VIEGTPLAITIGTLRGIVAVWSAALVAGVIVTQMVRRWRRHSRDK
jgi:hypothetical protein